MKLDILILAAHPDDAELGCGGTIAKHVALGHKVGIVDFTRGELGTRGTVETRGQEAAESAKILGISVRENLHLKDGFFRSLLEEQIAVVKAIRKYQPDLILANAIHDRHPDHGKGADLAFECSFLAGLAKFETTEEGKVQAPWRPKALYHYIQSQYIKPDIIVDVSDSWQTKMNAIGAFKTQFYDPKSKEPTTYISNPGFLKMVESRGQEMGYSIGVNYGEGFTVRRFVGVKSLFDII
ncbi:MAG: bacillithiol biosynthesis deacetylase BshB1 [Bacteroidia bacterium]|nr:bacillithiol biosynthesis deacetylase BshB1 [Bacteroidia bacterium]